MRSEHAVALADALLTGPWDAGRMVARARLVFAPVPVELAHVVDVVLAAHPTPPVDAPRSLQHLLLGLPLSAPVPVVAEGAPLLPTPRIRVVRRLLFTTSMVGSRFPLPRVDDVAALAERLGLTVGELDWFGDRRGWQRREPRSVLQHYRFRWLSRPGRTPRLLEAPRPRLKALQRQVLDELLAPVAVHPAVHGFVAGRSVLTGAAVHAGRDTVITLDLEQFFAGLTASRVAGVLRSAGYPEAVSWALTTLVCSTVPMAVLRAMPGAEAGGERFRLRRRLAAPHLPQGAPTSPHLANLAAFGMDRRLTALARRFGADYTRYADDLTFSGAPSLGRAADRLIGTVARIATAEGFSINPAKTRVRRAWQRQRVTGVVVNDRPAVARDEVDALRATLFNCVRFGPVSQNRSGVQDFRAHLLGRIAWVASTDARRGERLRALADRIDWN
ncbi:reverse transcriptase family protein [Nakamurella leprariae]|uniref:RNA-directed DNA polymerase n=1 Tax=Nakamurella leprariae TaxID=2803911 RepID=A0A939BVE0_9ACTN|nr:reverse transcriptase family protein [Nakamurella leprariae]MBM9466418.1 RNA-directed DNA polymerase [Nakamurella leprariae]